MSGPRLVLVANARMPSERAQSLQVAQASAAYARAGARVTLLFARRRGTPQLPQEELWARFAVPPGPRPSARAVSCVDWIERVPPALQYLPARLQEFSFARAAARIAAAEGPEAWVLSRELETARHLVRAGHPALFLELHRVPGGRLRRRWLREAAAGVRGIVAISGGVRADLLGLGVDGERVRVEHDGFEPARFAGAPSRDQARRRLGLPQAAPVVVYTGGLLAWKGVDVLVEAARRLGWARFVIAGGTEADVERLRARAAGLSHVRIDGFQPAERVPLYLAAADVGVVPNRSRPAIAARYTSPLKVFEAMAAGLALVASDLPALREILTHGEDAWLVPADDPDALAEGIERVLGDAELRRRLGERLGARAADHTWDARAARVLDWMRARLGADEGLPAGG